MASASPFHNLLITMDMDAVIKLRTKGLGIWDWARSEIDRFNLAIDTINRAPRLQVAGAQ